jgi:hypothetical protein
MKIKKLSPFILAFVLAGCVPVLSLNPLYDDRHIVFDGKLLGTFTEPNNITWEFVHLNESNVYQLTFSSVSEKDQKTTKGLFAAHLVKLDGRLFLDVFPKELPWVNDEGLEQTKWPYNSFFLVSAHTFLKVESLEPQLKLWLTDDDKMKELLKEDPNAIRNELVEGKPVLTASTQQLQSFVLKYADDKRVFPNEHILSRKPAEPNAPDANNVPGDSKEMPT